MFWPTAGFDEEFRESLDDVIARQSSSASSAALMKRSSWRSFTLGLVGADSSHRNIPANAWWVGRRGSCYVGIWCSKETIEEKKPTKDALIEVVCLLLL